MELNIPKLVNYLQKELKSDNEEIILRQFDHGQSNPTYYVNFGGEEIVLRKKPAGKLLRGAHMIEREYQVMKALHSANVPVPEMIALCDDQVTRISNIYQGN